MNHQTLVNTLLILAGIVLALALFAAGVYWQSRTGSRGGQAEPHVPGARIPPLRYSGSNALQDLVESELKTFHRAGPRCPLRGWSSRGEMFRGTTFTDHSR